MKRRVSFKKYSGFYFFALLLTLSVIPVSCFPPNGYFDRDKSSDCIYFDTKTTQVKKNCIEKKTLEIISISVEIWYDTVKITDGKPSSMHLVFEKNGPIKFPFSLDTIITDQSKIWEISLGTNKGSGYSYSIRLIKKDWDKGLLPFTYYYRK
jgi:hypothetical protein